MNAAPANNNARLVQLAFLAHGLIEYALAMGARPTSVEVETANGTPLLVVGWADGTRLAAAVTVSHDRPATDAAHFASVLRANLLDLPHVAGTFRGVPQVPTIGGRWLYPAVDAGAPAEPLVMVAFGNVRYTFTPVEDPRTTTIREVATRLRADLAAWAAHVAEVAECAKACTTITGQGWIVACDGGLALRLEANTARPVSMKPGLCGVTHLGRADAERVAALRGAPYAAVRAADVPATRIAEITALLAELDVLASVPA